MTGLMTEFFQDYEDASNDVMRANQKFFIEKLRAWFQTIDSNKTASPIIQKLESIVDFDKWYEDQSASAGGMVGSGILNWPEDQAAALGVQLSLLRAISANKIEWPHFAMHFLGSPNQYDNMVMDISNQIFAIVTRDLRKKIVRPDTHITPADDIPAADRVVRRDDNAEAFNEAISATQTVATAFNGVNDYANHDEKQRLIAEIAAGQTLLEAPEVRVAAVWSTVWNALRFLAKKAFDTTLTKLIGVALVKLAMLFGFSI